MSEVNTEIYNRLHLIYDKHRRKYKKNPDSMQMCCMWSTLVPPDIIEGTTPFCDIESEFRISINEEQCLEFYDMDIEEAAAKIAKMMEQQS